MPDIRDILNALDDNDRRLYAQIRTRMRGAYLQGLVEIVGIHAHDETDDNLLDLIDIKIGVLFDRSGRFDSNYGTLASVDKIETDIKKEGDLAVSKGLLALNKTKDGWPVRG